MSICRGAGCSLWVWCSWQKPLRAATGHWSSLSTVLSLHAHNRRFLERCAERLEAPRMLGCHCMHTEGGHLRAVQRGSLHHSAVRKYDLPSRISLAEPLYNASHASLSCWEFLSPVINETACGLGSVRIGPCGVLKSHQQYPLYWQKDGICVSCIELHLYAGHNRCHRCRPWHPLRLTAPHGPLTRPERRPMR